MSLKINNFQNKQKLPQLEHQVLDFWDQTKAFEESVKQRPQDNPYIFYDGPPFATGLPHYGHILSSTAKDVYPRFKTMQGYRVERVWGWDCHGVPIENIVEQQLNLQGGKKAIEDLGIDKFNQACRKAIWQFDQEWEKIIHRIGRWVDFKNSYKTMDTSFMESVWWAFKKLWEKELIYQGNKVILFCPRCSTPLSNFEIAMDNSYKDVTADSVYVKFPLKDQQNEYILAWTTTPWTLMGNVALAVKPDATYVQVKHKQQILWLAQDRLPAVFGSQSPSIIKKNLGKDLAGLEYQPLYQYLDIGQKKAFYVASADFVSLEEGSGIVHTAAIYGEDDYSLAQDLDLPLVPMLDDQGKFLDFVEPIQGQFFKKAQKWIMADLSQRDLLHKTQTITHSYPFCYRCDSPLFYNAVPAWFINIQKLKPQLKAQNQNINWFPKHLKHGRFGKGLDTAPDWNISRSRYWGTPMPVWVGETGQTRIIGSIEELQKWAVNPDQTKNLTDIHREYIDDIKVWVDDAKTEPGTRIPEVFDCWVESGSMPYASIHYPFQNKQKFEDSYPAQFITEYIAQTRAWFYTLHVMSIGLFGKHAFENALTTGTILAEDGAKMSKSKKNFPDPKVLIEKYGVDALRFYLMGSSLFKGDNLNFKEDQVKEIYQKLINILWNTFAFYKLYCDQKTIPTQVPKATHVLDRWIISRTHSLHKQLTSSLDKYDSIAACRLIQEFVSDLSTWYLRRSRDRLRTDKTSQQVFAWVFTQLAHLIAPITPFIAELIYQNLHQSNQSIHLNSWPTLDHNLIDSQLESHMDLARTIVEGLHSLRQQHSLPVRQPLASWSIDAKTATVLQNQLELEQIISSELNVTNYTPFDAKIKDSFPSSKAGNNKKGFVTVYLDIKLNDQLIQAGKVRDLIRQIQGQRKKQNVDLNAQINCQIPKQFKGIDPDLIHQIKSQAQIQTLSFGKELKIEARQL